MANEFARNIKDSTYSVTRALTAADGNVTSTDIDLGADVFKGENYELSIYVPSLTGSQLASADTLTIQVQNGSAASPTTEIGRFVLTGTGSTLVEQDFRFRLPSNAGRYLNVKFTTAGTTGDMSAKSAIVRLLF